MNVVEPNLEITIEDRDFTMQLQCSDIVRYFKNKLIRVSNTRFTSVRNILSCGNCFLVENPVFMTVFGMINKSCLSRR